MWNWTEELSRNAVIKSKLTNSCIDLPDNQ